MEDSILCLVCILLIGWVLLLKIEVQSLTEKLQNKSVEPPPPANARKDLDAEMENFGLPK